MCLQQSSVSMLLASTNKFGLDENFMPFGRIKRETLLEARRLLTEIRSVHYHSRKHFLRLNVYVYQHQFRFTFVYQQ